MAQITIPITSQLPFFPIERQNINSVVLISLVGSRQVKDNGLRNSYQFLLAQLYFRHIKYGHEMIRDSFTNFKWHRAIDTMSWTSVIL